MSRALPYLYVIAFFFISLPVYSQFSDSTILTLAERDPDQALRRIAERRVAADEHRDDVTLAGCYFLEGEARYYLGDYEGALALYYESRNYLLQNSPRRVKEVAKTYLAEAFIYLNDLQVYDRAITSLKKARPYVRLSSDQHTLSDLFSNLGAGFLYLDQLDSASHYFTHAYQLDQLLGDSDRIAADLISLGRLHVSWKDYTKGIEYYQKAVMHLDTLRQPTRHSVILNNIGMALLERGQFDSSGIYLMRALKKSEMISDSVQMAHRFNNLGLLSSRQNRYHQAAQYFGKSLKIYQSRGLYHWISRVLANRGRMNTALGKVDLAQADLQLAREIAEERDLHDNLIIIYQGLIHNYTTRGQLGQVVALHEKLSDLKDTIYGIENKRQLAEFDAKYQASEKQAALENLTLENIAQQAHLRSIRAQRRLLLLLLASVCLLAILGFALYRSRQKVRAKEREKVISLQLREIDDLQSKIANVLNQSQVSGSPRLTLEELNRLTLSPISKREYEILQGIAKGFSNKEIAAQHFVSINTVKFHLKNIYEKLEVRNRVQAVSKLSVSSEERA